MILILKDGSRFIVERPFWYVLNETKGFHHFKVIKVYDPDNDFMVGKRVAIPCSDIKYLVIGSY